MKRSVMHMVVQPEEEWNYFKSSQNEPTKSGSLRNYEKSMFQSLKLTAILRVARFPDHSHQTEVQQL